MFTEQDKEQICVHGAELSAIEQQLLNFKKGFPYADVMEAASINNGIHQFNNDSILKLNLQFDELSKSRQIVKFVPASGMASRMFKELFKFRNHYDGNAEQLPELQKEKEFEPVFTFIENLNRFAFYDDLKNCLSKYGFDIDTLLKEKKYNIIIDFLIGERGLNYAFLPKGLLKFHKYENHTRTAIEEHLAEGAGYCVSAAGIVNMHFTLSPEHIGLFETHIHDVIFEYQKQFRMKFNITHSVQSPATDTIAVDMQNEPMRKEDGSIIFRKGGHGALLKNLGESNADIVFIKNIDNIVPDRLKTETCLYKKAIGGLLMYLQDKIHHYLTLLDSKDVPHKEMITEIEGFCRNELMIRFPYKFSKYYNARKCGYLFNILNRPIRICGMVKNEGEPGGGPFWVRNAKGDVSLQIIESSQIDLHAADKKKIFDSATHFNPVDLVCGLKDYKGRKFNLHEFIDPETGFISVKSYNGTQLKAQELPGLWNGAMAKWITVFVEVPISTFNPVKTLNDLLRPEHQ